MEGVIINVLSPDSATRRKTFFRYLFRDIPGYVCISTRVPGKGRFEEEFFKWPEQELHIQDFIMRFISVRDIYFCPQILESPRRTKDNISICTCAWADLDGCPPDRLHVPPSITIETSANRYQAFWFLDPAVEPDIAEDISRRIAYAHADDGCDKSGWDLTQILRVPFTWNYKYATTTSQPPEVSIVAVTSDPYTVDSFNMYPAAAGFDYLEIPFPDEIPQAEDVLLKYKTELHPNVWILFHETPTEDWSKALWQLQMLLFESNIAAAEVFGVVREAHCNKYKRDNRSDILLWKEVCRAKAKIDERMAFFPPKDIEASLEPLLTAEERAAAFQDRTIIEDYTDWAKTLGDAAPQYHPAAAFIILSSLLAGLVTLPTSFGAMTPNLWFMILADTTLTRKTTAMDLAMDIILQIDPDAVLATDGSIEGLFTSLSLRPGRPSIFLRDEFSGLLEALVKKDYYAGMAETLTKLYDGKYQKRVLRKEVIEVRNPCLIFFAGGIRTRVLSLLDYEHIASGFMPRFIFITAESDATILKPLGPPTQAVTGKRDQLIAYLTSMVNALTVDQQVEVGGRTIVAPRRWEAELTPEAWFRYNQLESSMLDAALKTQNRDLMTPCMDRLAKSGLKAAVLIAASRLQATPDKVVVEVRDIIKAFSYIESWRHHTLDVLKNTGKTQMEKQLDQVLGMIKRHPNVLRSQVMQNYHLTSRDAEAIFTTLEQRGQIVRIRSGKSERLTSVEVM